MEMEMEMLLMKFESYLCDEEKSKSTINKYLHDVREMLDFMGQECISKELLIQQTVDKFRGQVPRNFFAIEPEKSALTRL
ncbi:hypothetical protein [Enterocloster bolteae]|uniref:hypothetical protein n=1 Tax=Enterocloster bolteae TaxID=208479 RepID=UPI001FAE2868|nr:hypothetical protein [Enterocloster bolteae]